MIKLLKSSYCLYSAVYAVIVKIITIFSIICSILSTNVLAQESYLLGPGDKITIKVFGEDDMNVETLLGNSGKVNYPFLGNISISGLTVKQVELFIEKGLKGDYLIDPNVYVQVVEYRPFYIHGEVSKPGGYPYHPGMTVNQAVALAGGLTPRADDDSIAISKEGDKSNSQKASLADIVNAGDTITIDESFF